MRRRLAAMGAVAAIAAAAFAFGGALRDERAAASPAPAPAALGLLKSGFGAGDTAALIVRLSGARDSASLTLLGFAHQQRARETGAPEHYPRAERALTQALALDRRNADALLGLAALAASRHRFAEALELGSRALRLRPDSAAVHGIVGDAQLELGRYADAFRSFDRAAALRPSTSVYARVSYARELLGEPKGALVAMKLAVDSAGANGEPAAWSRAQLGNLYLQRGRLVEAERQFRDALLFRPSYAPALAGLAEVAEARLGLQRADELYARALAAAPVPDYAVALGDVRARLGDRAGAKRAYAQAERLEGRFAAAGGRNALETALFDLDHDRAIESALARARRGYRERPSIEGEHVLAWALYKIGRCAEAKRHSIRALRLGTPDLDALYHRSLIERCLGNTAESRRFVARVEALDRYYLQSPPSPKQFRPRP